MNSVNTETARPALAGGEHEALFKAVHEAGEADSLALHHINNVVRLAAFACEARRTLQGIEEVLRYEPTAQKAVADTVPASRNWTQFDDVVGDVLQQASTQIEALAEAICRRSFAPGVIHASRENPATPIEGAA